MNGFLGQTIWLARNGDAEGWMNILFVVVLAAFYVIGSIVKAKSSKSKEEDQEQPTPKTHFKPAGQSLRQITPPQRKAMTLKPAVPKLPIKEQQRTQFPGIELPQEQKLPSLQLDIKEPRESITKPPREIKIKQLVTQPGKIQPRAKAIIEEPLVDFGVPDELKRAVLHYEILGKPLALRKSLEF
jgi:hypothetical protein